MVIEDLSDFDKKNRHSIQPGLTKILAPSADRLIACFLDILLHFPVFNFFIVIFLHKLRLLKWVTESSGESFYVIVQCAIVIFFSILVFQSIYFKVLNFTPGMYLMKLRLKSTGLDEISWGQAFLRSFIWIIGCISFGLPFLEIFSHKEKKLIHDRASETEIYSLKKNFFEPSPLVVEVSMVRSFYVLIGVAFLGWTNAFLEMSQNEIKSGRLAINEFKERGLLCEDVDEFSNRSHINISEPEARLEFAGAQFLLGQLDESCLSKEIDFSSLKNRDISNLFLVKALIAPAFSEDRKKYLKLSCEKNQDWCDSEFLIENSSNVNLREILTQVEKKWESATWIYKITALKLFNHLGQSNLALKVITSLQEDGFQSTGLIEQQTIALQRLERNPEVSEVLKGVRSVVIEKDFARLNSVLCLQYLDSSCEEINESCKNFANLISEHRDLLSEPGPARTAFKYYSCKDQLTENLDYWALVDDEDIQELIERAISLKQSELKAVTLAKLRVFIGDKAKSQDLRFDALQVLLHNTNYDKDWELVVQFWKEFSPFDDSYLSASYWLMNRAKSKNKIDEIVAINRIFVANPGLVTANRLPAEELPVEEKK